MKILALGHRKRTGKDTFARFLVTYLRTHTRNLNIQKAGFADKLKDICHQMFNWAGLMDGLYYDANPDQREMPLPKIGKTPREIWIAVGNEFRNVYEHVWIDYLLNKQNCDILIVTDLRYPNEFNRVKQLGGLCCKVVRPDLPITHDIADDALQNYEDNKWDHHIINDTDLNSLNRSAETIGQYVILSDEKYGKPHTR